MCIKGILIVIGFWISAVLVPYSIGWVIDRFILLDDESYFGKWGVGFVFCVILFFVCAISYCLYKQFC